MARRGQQTDLLGRIKTGRRRWEYPIGHDPGRGESPPARTKQTRRSTRGTTGRW